MMKITTNFFLALILLIPSGMFGQDVNIPLKIDNKSFDPATLLWYDSPASVWEEALPVGNGRLGAMVFGKYGEERLQLHEETYW